jgi:hypothetical protein
MRNKSVYEDPRNTSPMRNKSAYKDAKNTSSIRNKSSYGGARNASPIRNQSVRNVVSIRESSPLRTVAYSPTR